MPRNSGAMMLPACRRHHSHARRERLSAAAASAPLHVQTFDSPRSTKHDTALMRSASDVGQKYGFRRLWWSPGCEAQATPSDAAHVPHRAQAVSDDTLRQHVATHARSNRGAWLGAGTAGAARADARTPPDENAAQPPHSESAPCLHVHPQLLHADGLAGRLVCLRLICHQPLHPVAMTAAHGDQAPVIEDAAATRAQQICSTCQPAALHELRRANACGSKQHPHCNPVHNAATR